MNLLDERAASTKEKLSALRDRLRQHLGGDADRVLGTDTCVYVVGSGGRGEMSARSDADLFVARNDRPPSDVDAFQIRQAITRAIRPRPASTVRPWEDGYELASTVREALDWGTGPAPALATWLVAQGMTVLERDLPPQLTLVAARDADGRGTATVNPAAASRRRRDIAHATALGHVLFDVDEVAVDGAWEHWPTAARARAFGAMLLMPEEGLRELLAGARDVDVDAVRRVMARFGTGAHAATHHMKNLGFIPSDERREELVWALTA